MVRDDNRRYGCSTRITFFCRLSQHEDTATYYGRSAFARRAARKCSPWPPRPAQGLTQTLPKVPREPESPRWSKKEAMISLQLPTRRENSREAALDLALTQRPPILVIPPFTAMRLTDLLASIPLGAPIQAAPAKAEQKLAPPPKSKTRADVRAAIQGTYNVLAASGLDEKQQVTLCKQIAATYVAAKKAKHASLALGGHTIVVQGLRGSWFGGLKISTDAERWFLDCLASKV